MSSSLERSRGRRIRLVVAYDGTDFHGFARQNGLRTVQGVLEEQLERLLSHQIQVEGSGRTDKGVHAQAQVVHWDQPYGPPGDRYVHVLQNYLPRDIIPVHAMDVDSSFHARFSVLRKTYRYTLCRSKVPSVFDYRFQWNVSDLLDADMMRSASQDLVGKHDFTSFCAAAAPQQNKVREIYRIDIWETPLNVYIEVEGSGFLQYMVRIIVGTLVDIAAGRISVSAIPDILRAKSREAAGQTAPPHGLCLWNVEYPKIYGGGVLDLPSPL